jgi:ADP-heptose:LPS heptosyltransferase
MKILVIHPGSLGDIILSLPALHALRQAYPVARIDVLGNPAIFEILKERYYIDKVLSIDRGDVSACLTGQADPAEPLSCLLREYTFVVNWLGDQAGEFSSHLHRLGVRQIFSSRPISQKSTDHHRTQIFLDALAPLGIPAPLTRPCLFPSPEDKRLGQDALICSGINLKERPILAIHPGSGGVFKCWNLSRFVAVSRHVQEELGFRPLFILGPAEHSISLTLKNSLGNDLPILESLPLPVLAGALTWCGSPASGFASDGLGRGGIGTKVKSIFSHRRPFGACSTALARWHGPPHINGCYLGNDSGVTHLAAALDIPTVAVFGPTDPALWGPLGDRVTILSRRKEGCHVGDGACQGCNCLDLVTAEDVMRALANMALDYSLVIC